MTKARDNANGGLGLILIKPSSVVGGTDNGKGTVTFSGVTSISLNNIFSSTYDNYRLNLRYSVSAGGQVSVRGRTSQSDNSTSNYNHSGIETTSAAGPSRFGGTSQTQGYIQYGESECALIMDIFSPFLADETIWQIKGHSATTLQQVVTIQFSATTSFDGLSIYSSGGLMTGTVSVYGINK